MTELLELGLQVDLVGYLAGTTATKLSKICDREGPKVKACPDLGDELSRRLCRVEIASISHSSCLISLSLLPTFVLDLCEKTDY